MTRSPFCNLSYSHPRLTRSKALDGINLAFNSVQKVDHSMGALIGKRCMAQTAASPFNCSTAHSPQPVMPTHPMAWAAFLKCRSKAKRKAVTLSKVCLRSYVGRLDNFTEKRRLPDEPEVGSAEPRILNRLEVGSEQPLNLNRPGGGWKGFGAGVACTR